MDDRAPRRPNRSVWSQAAGTLRIFKGWQAIPAAILAVYLLVGILVPIDWESVRASGSHTDGVPPLGRDAESGELLLLGSDYRGIDLFDYVLWGAYQVALYAVPATLIGMAVGWAAAWGVSTLSRRLRYAAYAVLAAVFIPTVVSTIDVNELDVSLFPIRIRIWIDQYLSFLGDTHIFLSYNDSRISVSSYSAHWILEHPLPGPTVEAIGRIASIIMLAVPAAVCSFLIMTIFKYSRTPANQSSVQSHDENDLSPDMENTSTPPRKNQLVLWMGLNFFAGLSITTFIVSSLAHWYRYSEFMGLFPYYYPDYYNPSDRCEYPNWLREIGCYSASDTLLQWYSWMPAVVMLTVLASAILMVKWLSSEIRRESQRSSPVPSESVTADRSRFVSWLPVLIAAAIAILAGGLSKMHLIDRHAYVMDATVAVFAASSETAILAGALCGAGFAFLAARDSRKGGIAFVVFAVTMILLCSLGILLILTTGRHTFGATYVIVFIPFMVGAFGGVALSAARTISRSVKIVLAASGLAMAAASLLGLSYILFYQIQDNQIYDMTTRGIMDFSWIVVLYVGFGSALFTSMFGGVAIAARPSSHPRIRVVVPIAVAVIAAVVAGWTVYKLGFVAAFVASEAFIVLIPLVFLALSLFVSMYSNVRRGYDLFMWGGLAPILLFLLALSSPQLDYVPGAYLLQDRDEFGIFRDFILRNFLLAFMIAYLWLSAVRLQSIKSALGVAIAAAAVTYAAASLMLNDDNSARFLVDRFMEAIGYAPTDEEPAMSVLMGESGNYWIRTYAFGIIVSAVAAGGLSVYTLLRRAVGTSSQRANDHSGDRT